MFGGTTSVSGGLEVPLKTWIGVGVALTLVLTTPPRHSGLVSPVCACASDSGDPLRTSPIMDK